MQITVIQATKTQATSKAGKPYTFLDFAYKDSDGRVQGKKIMPFGESKSTFDTLTNAGIGEDYEITSVKNEAGFWVWIGAKKADGTTANTNAPQTSRAPAPAGKVVGSNYETAEERAKRQVFIVRQSSITAALSFLNNKAKSVDEVVQVAKEFEKYVFDTGLIPSPVALKVDPVSDFQDDVL